MRLWQDGIIALLASIGLMSILWALVRALLFPTPVQRGAVALICARGDGDELEQQVRSLSLLHRERRAVGEILLVDCGLSEEGIRVCRLLQRGDRRVTLCKVDEIEKYIN